MKVFHFDTPLQTDKFLGELLLDIASQPGKKKLFVQCVHFWFFLGHLGTESDFLQEMIKRNTEIHYLSFGGKSFLGKLSIKYYEQHGVNFKIIKKDLGPEIELISIGDYVIRIQFPKEFVKRLELFYKNTKRIEDLDYLEFGKLIKSNYKISLTLFKDKTMANSISKTVI